MLKYLHEHALVNLEISEDNADDAITQHALKVRRRKIEAQLSLARRAILMLKSLHADVSALRIGDGDVFSGIGDCEYGHEQVGIQMEWPNLAILIDESKKLLDEIDATDVLMDWHVFHGDCKSWFHCEAESREEAMQICAQLNPGSPVHTAVPSFKFGQLLMCSYGAEPVKCPRCGCSSDVEKHLPRDNWQVHKCHAGHHFIALPEVVEEEA